MTSTNATKPRVALIGAGGNLGHRTAMQLVAQGYTVRAISRPQTVLQDLHDAGIQDTLHLELVEADLKTLAGALKGCQALISTLGIKPPFDEGKIRAVETEGIKKWVDAARQAGLGQFVLCSSIGTERPETIPFLTPVLKAKREAELYLINSGLPYTIVRPGGLTDDKGGQPIKVGRGDQTTGRISREDVAAVLIAALNQPYAQGQVIEIVSDEAGRPPTEPTFFKEG